MRHQNFLAPIAFALGLAAAGVASAQTLTMGVRGGSIHSSDEFLITDSLAERAALSARVIERLSLGALN